MLAMPRDVAVAPSAVTGLGRAKVRWSATGGGRLQAEAVDSCSGTLKGLSPKRSIMPSWRLNDPSSARFALWFQ